MSNSISNLSAQTSVVVQGDRRVIVTPLPQIPVVPPPTATGMVSFYLKHTCITTAPRSRGYYSEALSKCVFSCLGPDSPICLFCEDNKSRKEKG
jgi:hypothetical protein